MIGDMELRQGQIVNGKIVKITPFGAFVELPNRQRGLIHISEISREYVKKIEDYVKVGETVKVKVLSKNQKGNYDLSLKQVEAPPRASKLSKESFEDKLAKFLKDSEERQLEIKKSVDAKRGIKQKFDRKRNIKRKETE